MLLFPYIGTVVAVISTIQIGLIIVTSILMNKSERPTNCPPFY